MMTISPSCSNEVEETFAWVLLLFLCKKNRKISILFLYNQKSSYFCAISYSKKRLDGKTVVIAILLHHLTTTCFIPQVEQSPPRLLYFLYIE